MPSEFRMRYNHIGLEWLVKSSFQKGGFELP